MKTKIKTDKAEELLRKTLKECGFDENRPDMNRGWEAFKDIGAQAFDCAGEGLLFETGIYDFTGEELYYIFLIREFILEVDGEFDYMEQLHLEFAYQPTERLRELDERIHSFEFDDDFDRFFEAVEQSPAFLAVKDMTPVDVDIYFDEV